MKPLQKVSIFAALRVVLTADAGSQRRAMSHLIAAEARTDERSKTSPASSR